ncbi:hypothetical protein OYT1_ch1597 [Ferriphaselus amnicola]|uniref:Uncharacterized protein n=1 Tax=Ferriphaselus amnicola TaxID=1188319 RepID=A0A2Z6GCP2_9PROT|nr:hypothetical protein [Ferriphaselus amnicola]BBE51144.1 hypothetical protein OYT1_ch1597 [Ferriphaselus amnicola]
MANLVEVSQWDPVYQLETTDLLEGGPDGIDNVQGKALANRTIWLKNKIESSANDIASAAMIDLSTVVAPMAKVTGTVETSAFTMNDGQAMRLIASAAWRLTHHAVNCNLPGGISYTCEPGDQLLVVNTGGVKYVAITSSGGIRKRLTANTTWYVATTGNDATGNGSFGSPWATMQHAYDWISNNIDANGFVPIISVANGTYAAGIIATRPVFGAQSVSVTGNVATPASCSIVSTTTSCFMATNGATLTISGFKVSTSGANSYGIIATTFGVIYTSAMDFGACTVAHITASLGGYITLPIAYAITGNATYHVIAQYGGTIQMTSATATIAAARAFTYFVASHNGQGEVLAAGWSATGAGVAGTTGQRYYATMNGVINTNGSGANLFPGSIPGTVATGGQYV